MNEEDKFCISNRNWIGLMMIKKKKIWSEKRAKGRFEK